MKVVVAISTTTDGNMLIRDDPSNKKVIQNRSTFLSTHDISMKDATRTEITYTGDNYRRYREISFDYGGNGMSDKNSIVADALATREPNHALFLPLADCVGAVIFDPDHSILMLSHLGRHSLEQRGGYESVKFLADTYNSDPSQLLVWLTPAPGQENYPLFAFDNRSMKDVVFEQLQSAGVSRAQITDNPADTTTDANYYSHSEFLKGNRAEDGRFAIVVMMKN